MFVVLKSIQKKFFASFINKWKKTSKLNQSVKHHRCDNTPDRNREERWLIYIYYRTWTFFFLCLFPHVGLSDCQNGSRFSTHLVSLRFDRVLDHHAHKFYFIVSRSGFWLSFMFLVCIRRKTEIKWRINQNLTSFVSNKW